MNQKVKLPMYLTWKALKQIIGWPYSRTQTVRMMRDPDYDDRRFPPSRKLGPHRSSRPVWYTPEILEYFKRHGLTVPENIEFS